MARPAPKTLVLANIVMPCVSAAVFVATALDDAWHLLAFAMAVIVLLGLTIVNLVAPAVLWRRHGVRSLIPLGVFIVVGGVCVVAGSTGYTAMNSQTPASATFLRGPTQRDLESAGNRLLNGGKPEEVSETLQKYGLAADVDTAGRVVTFRYYRMRSWTKYYFAPNGLPGPLVTEPRITGEDIPDWGGAAKDCAVRRIGSHARGASVV